MTLNEIRSQGYRVIGGSKVVAKMISKCLTLTAASATDEVWTVQSRNIHMQIETKVFNIYCQYLCKLSI